MKHEGESQNPAPEAEVFLSNTLKLSGEGGLVFPIAVGLSGFNSAGFPSTAAKTTEQLNKGQLPKSLAWGGLSCFPAHENRSMSRGVSSWQNVTNTADSQGYLDGESLANPGFSTILRTGSSHILRSVYFVSLIV